MLLKEEIVPDYNDLKQFSFSFDPSLEETPGEEPTSMDEVVGADPGVFLPNIEGRSEFLAPDPDRVPVIPNAVDQTAPEYAARPASERTRELFAHMNPHRQVLLGVLRAAMEPCSDDQMQQVVDDLRAHKFSVYAPSNICTMLETAGALERVTADGAPYGDMARPAIVVIDGEEFYEPTKPPCVCWKTTEAGKEMLAANNPLERIEQQLQREPEFLSIYKRILTLVSDEAGATMAQLSGAVDSDPLVSTPRRFFVQHFVEALERCECVAWQGSSWAITEIGKQVLEGALRDVIDNPPVMSDTPKQIPTETQGVNW